MTDSDVANPAGAAQVDTALLAWTALRGPRKVLDAARRRLEDGHDLSGNPLRVTLTPEERADVGRLLGLTWDRSGQAVSAQRLARAVSERGTNVPALLAAIGIPVRPLRAEKQAARQAADAEREQAAALLADVGISPGVAAGWLARRGLPAAGTGQLADLARRCARAWCKLPGPGGQRVLLTVLAASALGDPHALDRGSPVATGLLRLLGHDNPDSAEAWRAAWEEHGVDCDPVSSRVLVLNLRLNGTAGCVRISNAAGAEPLWLTFRSLTGTITTGEPDVYVCENPSVLIAAADTLDEQCKPLVCLNGRPSAATMTLLAALASSGATLHVRADDDPVGQEIVAGLRMALPRSRPWRYELRPPQTPRYEEQDLEALLRDLRRGPP